MEDLSLQKIIAARKALRGKVLESPILPLYDTATSSGNPIIVKAECLQPSGSFKIRGATYFLSKLTRAQRKRGCIAYSTGNHAQAVSLAALKMNISTQIIMSQDVPSCKIEAVKKYGAQILFVEPSSEIRKQTAEEMAKKQNLILVPPYDHLHIIAGQGTIGIEIMDQTDPSAVFVAVGGGGLITGIAIAIKKINPKIKIIGVEPELENDAWQSFKYNTKITLQHTSNTIADAIRVQTLGQVTYPLMKKYVDEMIQVSEDSIAEATLELIEKTHLFVEPAGALAYAGARHYKKKFTTKKPVVVVASGGNTSIDFITGLKNRFPNEG